MKKKKSYSTNVERNVTVYRGLSTKMNDGFIHLEKKTSMNELLQFRE